VVFDGKKNYYDVRITFAPLSYTDSETLKELFRSDFGFASDIVNGIFPAKFYGIMTDRSVDVFPFWSDLNYKCSCKKSKKCEHVAAVIHRILNEIIFEPSLLFSLRGYKCDDIFSLLANDPDFTLSEPEQPEELTIEHYSVKSSSFDVSEINPLIYYGVDIPEPDLSDVQESRITDSRIYHGKIRDEFYGIFDSLTEILKVNAKKF
jgi:uncharacterized Zn finger protein